MHLNVRVRRAAWRLCIHCVRLRLTDGGARGDALAADGENNPEGAGNVLCRGDVSFPLQSDLIGRIPLTPRRFEIFVRKIATCSWAALMTQPICSNEPPRVRQSSSCSLLSVVHFFDRTFRRIGCVLSCRKHLSACRIRGTQLLKLQAQRALFTCFLNTRKNVKRSVVNGA